MKRLLDDPGWGHRAKEVRVVENMGVEEMCLKCSGFSGLFHGKKRSIDPTYDIGSVKENKPILQADLDDNRTVVPVAGSWDMGEGDVMDENIVIIEEEKKIGRKTKGRPKGKANTK
jgi:hypothetical protein